MGPSRLATLMSHVAALLLALLPGAGANAREYLDNARLESALQAAVAQAPDFLALKPLVQTRDGRTVWRVRAGADLPSGPAMLIVAGLDGRHHVGTEMAVSLVERLATDEAAREALAGRTLHIIPRVNLPAVDAWFAGPKRALASNLSGGDTDHDGLRDEDKADDMNGDGIISQVLVRDGEGGLVLDGPDGAFTRPADRAKGERGEWRLLTEGLDDDRDEDWNEEEDAGVNFARNFTHDYEWFARDAGVHQISEPETRALAEFLAAHPEIAVVLVYGIEDNLFNPPGEDKASDADPDGLPWGRKPLKSMLKGDVEYLAAIAESFRKSLNLDKPVTAPDQERAARGSFGGFAHFARGRMVLNNPVWFPAYQLKVAKPDAPEKKGEGNEEDKKEEKAPEEELDEAVKADRDFRDWLEANAPGEWLPWSTIDHADFPGKEARVGGFGPLARMNPPAVLLDDLATTNTAFVLDVASKLPRVSIRGAELERIGTDLYQLDAEVENAGFLPDVAAIGRFSRHVRPTRLEIDTGGGEVVGGLSRILLKALPGSGGFEKHRLLLRLPPGGNSVTLRLISEQAGRDERTVTVGGTR